MASLIPHTPGSRFRATGVEPVRGEGLTLWHEAPIYDRLVAELGDIPAQVRSDAERTVRQLAQVIRPSPPTGGGLPQPMRPFTTEQR